MIVISLSFFFSFPNTSIAIVVVNTVKIAEDELMKMLKMIKMMKMMKMMKVIKMMKMQKK